MKNPVLDEVKNYLDITWDDEGTDKKLQGIIDRATSWVVDYFGMTAGCLTDPSVKQLFLDCCRYMWANAFEDFETNFAKQITGLQIKYEVMNLVES